VKRIEGPEDESFPSIQMGEEEAKEIMEFAGKAVPNDISMGRISEDEDDEVTNTELTREV
jgi:hypothetical protein